MKKIFLLLCMLVLVSACGRNGEDDYAVDAPTIRVAKMTVAGGSA